MNMMRKIMLSCKAATLLIEKKHRARLTMKENVQLALHKTMCDACRLYEKQSEFLERLFKNSEIHEQLSEHSCKELEEQILTRLDLPKPKDE